MTNDQKDAAANLNIARRMADERVDRGWSADDLAKRLDIDPAILMRLERGHHVIGAAFLLRVAAAFGVPVSTLLETAFDPQPVGTA